MDTTRTEAPVAAREAPTSGRIFDVLAVLDSFRDPLRVLTETRRELGDVACIRFLANRYYLVSDPEAARHVLVENHRNYHKSRNYIGLKVLLGEGLLTAEATRGSVSVSWPSRPSTTSAWPHWCPRWWSARATCWRAGPTTIRRARPSTRTPR
jgi:hypothetical protein